MPVNDRYPLADVLAECRRYAELRHRKVFVEYVMLAGVNDSPDDARLLAELLGRGTFKVNLIPYNPTGRFDGSSREAIAAFKARAGPRARPGDGTPHQGAGHRRRLRPTRGRGPRAARLATVFHTFTQMVADASGWAYLIVFLFAILDAVVPLVPSETAVITAGVVAANGDLSLALIIPAAATGAFIGDNSRISSGAGSAGARRSASAERRASGG